MRRVGVALWVLELGLVAASASPAWADENEDEDAERGDEEDDDEEPSDPDGGFRTDDDDIERQGEDEGEADEPSEFERNLFYVDKVDDADTIDRTLWQGSLTTSTFLYREQGGALGGLGGDACADPLLADACVRSSSPFARAYGELRFLGAGQHLGGGNWDLRVDARLRGVLDPDNQTTSASTGRFDVRAQSGSRGRNEADLRELTMARLGERSRIVIGRQLVGEFAGTRLDGARVDLRRGEKWTLIGFAGLSPLRAARSIGLEYPKVVDENGMAAGRLLTITGGAGAAYRMEKVYGAFGAATMVPGKGSTPRVFLTSNGYLRTSPQLDVYHYAVVDVMGDAGAALTNLSAGADYRPRSRIRLSAALHRVDTEALDLAYQKVLDAVDGSVIQNGTELRRIASNQARFGFSASLGQIEQIEVSTALSFRQRGEIPVTGAMTPLPAAQNGEVWAQAVHRDLWKTRVGVDVSRSFGVGGQLYGRSTVLAARVFASREFKEGRGEWDAELGYASVKDDAAGASCDMTDLNTCYGASSGSTLSARGTVYYLIKPELFAMGSVDLSSSTRKTLEATGGARVSDPAVVGLGAFARLAYRF